MDRPFAGGIALPMLDGSNYRLWKLKMRAHLEDAELEDVVYGKCLTLAKAEGANEESGSAEDATTSPETSRQLKKRETRARMMLICSVDTQHMAILEACKTAREIWSRLEIEYADKEPVTVEALLTEYYTYKMDGSKSISEYVAHVESLVGKLAELGNIIPEPSVMAKIVSGLPMEYSALRRVWDMTPSEFKTRNLLIANLRKEEKALNATGTSGEALIARSSVRQNSYQRGRGKTANKESLQDKKKKSTCKWCKQVGHWWRECPTRPANRVPDGVKNTDNAKPRNNERALCSSFLSQDKHDDDTWYLDSGASAHMTYHRDWFDEYKPLNDYQAVKVGNGEYLYAIGIGSIRTVSIVDGIEYKIRLRNVRHVPKISNNLFSVGAADESGAEVKFRDGTVSILDEDEVIITGNKATAKLYKLDLKVPLQAHISRTERTLEEWHSILGHADINQVKAMAKSGCVNGMRIVEYPKRAETGCTECQLGKGKAASHPTSKRPRATRILERVHMDSVGPIEPSSLGGSRYFLLMRDEFSGFMFVDFMNTKQHVLFCVKRFVNEITTTCQEKVRILRFDNGTEFKNQGIKFLCDAEGIIREYSSAYTPQQNGEAERANRTVIETGRAMLQGTELPLSLWAEAINTAVYVRNRTPNSRSDGKTAFELFFGRKPDLSHLVRFGQEVHILDHGKRASKFSPKTTEAFVVGYGSRVNTYKCYDALRKDVTTTSDVVQAAHKTIGDASLREERTGVTFFVERESQVTENTEITVDNTNPATIDLPDVPEEVAQRGCTLQPNDQEETEIYESPRDQTFIISRKATKEQERATPISVDEEQSEDVIVSLKQTEKTSSKSSQAACDARCSERRSDVVAEVVPVAPPRTTSRAHVSPALPTASAASSLTRRVASATTDWVMKDRQKRNVNSTYMRGLSATILEIEPKSYSEAIASTSNKQWASAIDAELAAHKRNGTWEIVPKVANHNEISSRWIVKLKDDVTSIRYKARLVARGFTQVKGIDYGEIFAPVVRMDSIRLLFSICAQFDLIYAQFDITTAFLNGTIEEELYLEPPEGLNIPESYTCRLRKSLYGLKQAPRRWNIRFTDMLKQFNMKQCPSDPCVYINANAEPLILALYVDDGLIFAKYPATIDKLIKYLTEHFEVKVVTSACFLGMEIVHNKADSSIFLHQKRYIQRVLERYNMSECKGAKSPLEVGHSLHKPEVLDTAVLENIPYAETLGSLMYCATATRPDLAHTMSVLSKYASSPREQHWKAMKRALRYLQETQEYGLLYKPVDNPRVTCYSDADWAGDQQNRKSTSGMITFLTTGPITYKSQQQPVQALSSTEAEYIAAALAVKDLIWIQRFMEELRVPLKHKASLLCDNQSAIRLIRNPEFHQRTKHIDIKYHFIRDRFEDGCFELKYVSTDKQKVDVFTKALTVEKHRALCCDIGCTTLKDTE